MLKHYKGTITVNTKAANLAANELEFVITTEDVDRDGEVLDLNGLDVSSYMKNPVVLLAHDYGQNGTLPIARCTSLVKGLVNGIQAYIARAVFAVEEYDVAKTVYALYKSSFMFATSIGFLPTEGTWDDARECWVWTKADMMEFSCVNVPANPQALLTAKSKGIDIAPLEKFEKGETPKDSEEKNQDPVTKDGRMISEPNMKRLKAAHTHITKILKAAGEDMGSCPEWPMPDDPQSDVTSEPVNSDSADPDATVQKQEEPATKPSIQAGKPMEKLHSRAVKRKVKFVVK